VRALGVIDLTWLYLGAVVNLNIVPVVAVAGFQVMWLWCVAILLFFVPQGISVIELAEHMPGEGGLYLWTKESYGDFHGFLCGRLPLRLVLLDDQHVFRAVAAVLRDRRDHLYCWRQHGYATQR
jgi:amino acid transporter